LEHSSHDSGAFDATLDTTQVIESTILSALDVSETAAPARRHEAVVAAPEAPSEQAPLWARIATMAAVVIPPFAVVAVMVLAWGGWFHWVDLAVMLGMYLITGLGVTIGYHRLYTHRSFATRGPIAALFAICGSMAAQGPIVCWLFHDLTPDMKRYVPDLLADKTTMRIHAMFPLLVVIGFAIPAVIGGLVTMSWMGALLGFLWGGIVRMFLLHHVTWSVNSVCHIWGAKEYHSGDESRNNPVMGILALGEGWHNNHHAFPASARHGLKWWQFDLSWVIIRTLERVGLAKKVRLPAEERLAARRV